MAQDYGLPLASSPAFAAPRGFVRLVQQFWSTDTNFWFCLAGIGLRHEDRDDLRPLNETCGRPA